MKKLLFAVTTDLNYDQRMQRICTSLAQNGYEVLLVGRQWPDSKPLPEQPYRQHRLQCWFSKGKLFYLEFNLRLLLYLLRQQADAFCAIDLDTALPVWFKARLAGKPFLYDAHEYFPEVPEVTNRKLVKKFWLWAERFIVSRTTAAYTVSQSIATVFERQYGKKFEVIRNISRLQPKEKSAGKAPDLKGYILYQGAVNEGRGLDELLEALPQLNRKLIICGKGDILEKLQKKVLEKGLSGKVEFKGYVRPDELKEITRNAWLGFNLLENKGLSYYYSLSNKFFDYLHAGVPQLAPSFPEYETINRAFEVAVLTELSVENIIAAIKKLENEPEFYSHLAGNCRLAREHFNWQQEEQKLLKIYSNLWK